MTLVRVGVDLAKNVFQVHGVERNEKAVWRRRLSRDIRGMRFWPFLDALTARA